MSEKSPFQSIDETSKDDGISQDVSGSDQSADEVTSNPFRSIPFKNANLSIAKSAGDTGYEEPNKVFATGLPAWSLEPPGEFVIRKPSRIKEEKE